MGRRCWQRDRLLLDLSGDFAAFYAALPNLDEREHFFGFYGGFLELSVNFRMSETKLTHPETQLTLDVNSNPKLVVCQVPICG